MAGKAKGVDILDYLESTFVTSFEKEEAGLRESRPEFHDLKAYYESVLEWEMPPYLQHITENLTDESIKELLILCPPGHGKTTLLCVLAAWLLGRNPNLRIMVATHTLIYSQRLINMICGLLSRPVSRLVFGDLIPSPNDAIKWTSNERYLNRSDFRLKDPSLSAVAVGSSTIGGRCDLVIADDLVTQSNSMTPTMREHIWAWWNASLMTRFDKGGRILMAGTRFYKGDLYGELEKLGFRTIKLTSTVEKPLWPQQKDSAELARLKSLDYAAYMAQYCAEPVDYGDDYLKEEWLSYYITPPPNMRYYIGVDPCASDKSGTDPMAMVVLGVDINKTIHVVEVMERQANKRAQVEAVASAIKRYNAVLCGVEANAAQRFILEDLEEAGVPKSRLLPIQTQLPKGIRFGDMANLFRTRRALLPGVIENGFLVPHPKVAKLVDEWRNYPSSDDHLLDALELAIQAAIKVIVTPAVAISVATPPEKPLRMDTRNRFVGVDTTQGGRRHEGYRPLFH